MTRYALLLEYDGRPFSGWQRQADQPSVQGALEAALAAIDGGERLVEAAGRTDSGVHATGQVAHVDLSLIRNAFQFRLMMERDAVGAFVREAPIEEIERLAEAHKRVIKEAAKRITPETIRRAQIVDWDMHDTIVDFLGNEIVSSAYRVNSIKIRLIRQAEVRLDPGRVETVMREHLAIVDLIRARDAERATAALAAHIQDARNRALGLSP